MKGNYEAQLFKWSFLVFFFVCLFCKDFWLQVIELKITLFQLENCPRTQALTLQRHCNLRRWDHSSQRISCSPMKRRPEKNNFLIAAGKSTTPSNQYLRPEKLVIIIKCMSPNYLQFFFYLGVAPNRVMQTYLFCRKCAMAGNTCSNLFIIWAGPQIE